MTIIEVLMGSFVPCTPCDGNARNSEDGGDPDAAHDCRAHCRDGHGRTGAAQAASLLVREGAQFVEQALADNPEGPVAMITTIEQTETIYDVVIGDVDAGDHGRARMIWRKRVTFGQTDATVAGGRAFVEAARSQDAVARAVVTLLRRPAQRFGERCPRGFFCVHDVKCPGAV